MMEDTLRTTEPLKPSMKSDIHIVRITLETNPIDPHRLFCQLSWTNKQPTLALKLLAEKEVEDAFFRYFARFGEMEYCYTTRDAHHRLSHGFVRYHIQRDASRALREAKSRYRVRPAQGQYQTTIKLTQKVHLPCGYPIDARNRNLHITTCQR